MTWFSPWLADHRQFLLLWLGAICTLGLYSILYRENKIYRFFEHIYLGLATGYMVAEAWNNILLKKWWTPMWTEGRWWFVFTAVAGLFYYFIYTKKYAWLARLMIGLFLGITSGQTFKAFVNDTWPQIPKSFKPIIPHGAITDAAGKVTAKAVTGPDAFNNLIFMLILLCVMSYFFFSFELNNRVIKTTAQWGRWLLMFAFGAIFGSTIMARLALLIDRMDYLINEVGPTLGGSGPLIMNLLLVLLGVVIIVLALRPGAKVEEITDET